MGDEICVEGKFVDFDELGKGSFGFEGFILFDIEEVLVFFVFLVEILEVGLGPEGFGVVSHFNEIYNKRTL